MDIDIKKDISDTFNQIVSSKDLGKVNPTQASLAINDMKRGLSEREKLKKKRKEETKEVTGSGSAGGYSTPLFSGEEPDIKKVEATEATSSSSVGMYDAPGFEDVNMRGNNPKGSGRSYKETQIPGGSFVEVKSKCKKFPYCNQGDINALKIFKNKKLNEAIINVSKNMNISERVIREIIVLEYKKIIKDTIN